MKLGLKVNSFEGGVSLSHRPIVFLKRTAVAKLIAVKLRFLLLSPSPPEARGGGGGRKECDKISFKV